MYFIKFFKGIKLYYHRDGAKGVAYFLKHRFYNKLIKPLKHSDLFLYFNPERIIAKRFERQFLAVEKSEFYEVGNYYLSNKYALCSESIIYSLGVLNDTEFDQALSDKYGCNIFMFDPSMIATKHIGNVDNPKFIFREIAVWIEKKTMLFSSPLYGGSPSMLLEYKGKKFEAQCERLSSLMTENHHTFIDVLKMDIEGAAPHIINDMLDSEIYPNQIVAEFERPNRRCVEDFLDFYQVLRKLIKRLESLGYKMRVMPRVKFKYFSIELIFVKC